jgi:tetratricopeptide (TPR) repeat protein
MAFLSNGESFEFTLEARIRKLFHMSRSLLVLCLFGLFVQPVSQPAWSQTPAEQPAAPEAARPQPQIASSEPASASGLFEKGLEAYQKRQFSEAREDFQKVLDQNSANPRVNVLHNLALAEYQLDQKPLALANWRKALSLRPDFKPARVGRDLLESQSSAMRPFERDSLALWQRRTLEHFSLYQILWLEALLLGLVGSIGIRYFSERRAALDGQLPLPSFPALGAALALALLLTSGVIGLKLKEMFTTRATVIAGKASVRSLPADDGVSLFELSGGTELLVHRITDGWLQVQSSDGLTGWVKGSEAMITSQR